MKTNDPRTWHDISNHPALEGGEFDPSWYDGDVNVDLQMLRVAATEILSQHPQYECELFLLDDCTMYMTVEMGGAIRCSIYPAKTDDDKPSYFLDIESNDKEIRVESVEDVLGVLEQCKKHQ